MGIFQNVTRQYIRNQLYAGNRIKSSFCRLCYELRIDAENVPKLFGIPLLGAECLKHPAVLWQLQAAVAWEKGIPVDRMIASGRFALTDPSQTEQVLEIVADYLTLYVAFKDISLSDSELLASVYDIYCKNLRKLRK